MRSALLDDGQVTLYLGDCIEVMAEMEADSIDALVCDPPYSLSFMGRAWDSHRSPRDFQAWCQAWATEALRVLKPGGHLLAFGGTRTYHRLTAGIEDAGFEIRDCLAYLYGSGFPKSLVRSLPSTPEAARWDGYGTALKPAFEPIVLARKPLIGTVAANVTTHGTGALNIDACRIDSGTEEVPTFDNLGRDSHGIYGDGLQGSKQNGRQANYGRWPANVVLGHTPECVEVGTRTVPSNGHHPASRGKGGPSLNGHAGQEGLTERREGSETIAAWNCSPECAVRILDEQTGEGMATRGGASRFFYTAKAGRADRGEGNDHPTVKPIDLMRWLVKLVVPPDAIVLDCFGGSGTTGEAAIAEGRRVILIERDEHYCDLIMARLARPIAQTFGL